jgi:hypothetical protein
MTPPRVALVAPSLEAYALAAGGVRLEETLADWRGQAAVLRHNGHKLQAESIEAVCADVAVCLRDYLDCLEEAEAHSRSGRSIEWFRSRFADWEAQGLAERRGKRRFYRRIIVPRRPNLEAARAQAEREAKRSA